MFENFGSHFKLHNDLLLRSYFYYEGFQQILDMTVNGMQRLTQEKSNYIAEGRIERRKLGSF